MTRNIVPVGRVLRCGGRKAIALNVATDGADDIGISMSFLDLKTTEPLPAKRLVRERPIFRLSMKEVQEFNSLWNQAIELTRVLAMQVAPKPRRR